VGAGVGQWAKAPRLKRMGGLPLGLQTAEPNRHVISPKNLMRYQGNASFTACDERGS